MQLLKYMSISILLSCPTINALAATSLMASGHAGFVWQYTANTPPLNSTYSTIRVPVGLTLQASPTDNLNVYLGLDYAYNNYPQSPTLLGQTTTTTTTNPNGQATPMPFTNTTDAQNNTGGTSYGQKSDVPTLTTAYFDYQSSIGLLKAGRFPRHWGLGIWFNDEWSPIAGSISTSDALALTTDFNMFDVSVYYERYGQSIGGTSSDGNATAYTLEVRLKTDPADVPSSGVTREIGFLYSKFEHTQSNTTLNIVDAYGRFYLSKFFVGAEVLYPTGQTQNPNYQSLGGAPQCSQSVSNSTVEDKTCSSQDFSAFAALAKFKLLIDGDANSSLAATEEAQKLLGSAERPITNTVGVWVGYASGGNNQFTTPDGRGGNKISAIYMNPNIQPAFLMFNTTTPPINGMPTGAITNTTFARVDYTYSSPSLGSIGPVFTWAKLNKTNATYNDNTTACQGAQTVDSTIPINRVCVGGTSALGYELDVSYRYTTLDRVLIGADLGYWLVGNAWKIQGQNNPDSTYGARMFAGFEF